MKNFVRRILLEKGFSIDEDSFADEMSFQADRIEGDGFDFLTVCAFDEKEFSIESLREKWDQYYLQLAEKRSGIIGMDKNLSLLILLKVESKELSFGVNSLIFDIEEDPYTFKKYVLTYTDQQETLLLSRFNDSKTDVTSFLYQLLNDAKCFAEFKNQEATENALVYDLVSKLFIKLPFLSMKNQFREIDFVLKDILGTLTEEDRGTWDSLMELKLSDGNNPDIEQILAFLGDVEVE
ncbi:hypothetical protein HUN92_21620 [Bacillus firmus]|uniref:ABC-three component system middle component 1 n=1 Tax=Cytobacillus firmus TaxID=1399 RepID=UPI0015804937|nr:ABC-three component system middle component 1 [Cytobacillus firmus]NUH86248.1 hypothetical protein [Cytobacillus firmus]